MGPGGRRGPPIRQCDPRGARLATRAYGRRAVFVCRFIDRLTRRVAGAPRSIRVRSAVPPSRPPLRGPDGATPGAGNARPTRHGATERPRSVLLGRVNVRALGVAYHPG